MRVLYGVVGEGMGHAIRSQVVIDHLLAEGHEIEIMASSRAADHLGQRFKGVNKIHGFHMIADENRIKRGMTVWSNVIEGTASLPSNIAAYYDLLERFEPEVVISDFESWTYLYGKNHRIPVISIDNMQIINRCDHADEILADEMTNYLVTKTFVKTKLPFCDHYLITTFFYPPVDKKNTSLHPPILRPEILEASPSDGGHLLVYQTKSGYEELEKALAGTGMECRIYGMRRDLQEEVVEGNLRYRPFSGSGFIEDLASAQAVIAGAGFTLMGEAVYLRKPMLAIPLAGQFEQILNGRYLRHEGFGDTAEGVVDSEVLDRFVGQLPRYRESLSSYSQNGNRQLLDALDHELDKAAAGLY